MKSSRYYIRGITIMILLGMVLSSSVFADEAYTPKNFDMLLNEGKSQLVTVQILNLTPYDMTLSSSGGLTDQTTVNSPDPFFFAATGLPRKIPGVPAQAFTDPNYVNTQTHPYPMIISWQDADQFYTATGPAPTGPANVTQKLTWTYSWMLNNVNGKNVQFNITVNRTPKTNALKASTFALVVDPLKEAFKLVRIAVDPANPVRWVKAFTGVVDLAKDVQTFNALNSQKLDGPQMYLNSYIYFNANTFPGVQTPPGSTPPPGAPVADDAVIVKHDKEVTDDSTGSIVVISSILREEKPADGKYGTIPAMMITVMRWSDWQAAQTTTTLAKYSESSPAASELQRKLTSLGPQANFRLAKLVRGLDDKELKLLADANLSLSNKKAASADQEKLFKVLAEGLKQEGEFK